jgi:hypothetical protein
MIHVGNGVVEFRSQNKITTLYTITPFCPFQLAETKVKRNLKIDVITQEIVSIMAPEKDRRITFPRLKNQQ